MLQHYYTMQGVTRGVKRGAIPRAPNHYGGAEWLRGVRKISNSVTNTSLKTANSLPQDLRFKHGDGLPRAPSNLITPLVSCRSTPQSRTALQGSNEEGKVALLPGAKSLWGRRKSQPYHKCFLQYSIFASERSQVRTWGRQTCFLPRAPSNLVTPLLHWHGSIPETGFWLCKLPKSCVSYKFSIAFLLYCLLLFLSKLPSSITNELVKNICTQLSDKSRTVLTKATAFVIAEQF